MTQSAPKPLTDFNDLHAQRGLEEVRRQLLDAVQGKAATESPASTASSVPATGEGGDGQVDLLSSPADLPAPHREGEAPPEKADETGAEVMVFTLEMMLQRYAYVMNETKVWDTWQLELIKKGALTDLVGKDLFKEWLNHAQRKSISMVNVRSALAALPKQGGEGVEAMLARYVLIYGTKDIWDHEARRRIPADSIKLAWPNDYPVWIEHRNRRMVTQEQIVFDPTMRVADDCINTFDGLPLSPLTVDESNFLCLGIRMLLRHLCENNDDVFQWMLRWLALPLQQPGTKLKSACLFHGEVQGAGKSLFFSDIHRQLYSNKYSATLGQHQLESQYTDWKSNKLYMVFEEIFSGASRYAHLGTVKHMITGTTQRVEQKFVSGWEEANYSNAVFLSNEIQPLPVEPRDRRMLVCWPNSKVPPQVLADAVADMNRPDDLGYRAWYGFLLSLPMDWVDSKGEQQVFHANMEPPMTASKERLIEYGLPAWECFYRDWKAGSLDVPYCSCLSLDLYRAYSNYCHRRGEKPLTETKFGTNMSVRETKRVERYWKGQSQTQATMIVVGQCPDGIKKAEWLTEEIGRFAEALRGKNDQEC